MIHNPQTIVYDSHLCFQPNTRSVFDVISQRERSEGGKKKLAPFTRGVKMLTEQTHKHKHLEDHKCVGWSERNEKENEEEKK